MTTSPAAATSSVMVGMCSGGECECVSGERVLVGVCSGGECECVSGERVLGAVGGLGLGQFSA